MKATLKKRLKYIAVLLLAILVIIQFFPIDKSAPEYDSNGDFITATQPSEEVKQILKTSCYDCHSFETQYPWYSNVAPVSWWLKDHVNDGRKHLNFSTWTSYDLKRADHKLEEVIEEVEEHAMPLSSYLITHSEARLTPEKEKALTDFVTKLRSEINTPRE